MLVYQEQMLINHSEQDEKEKRIIKMATNLDVVKAMRRGGREAEREMLGPGFHSFDRLHRSIQERRNTKENGS